MIVPKPIEQRFLEIKSLVEAAGRRAQEALAVLCEERGFLLDRRFKSLESLAEKIESGRFSGWNTIDDLFACTVVIPSIARENEVINFLREKFAQVGFTRRGEARKPPDVFRFDATRFVGKLRPPEGMDIRGSTVYQIRFEVQIQTMFEYAWAKTTHSLVYKSDQTDWRRFRVAAQIKAAVEQLDMLLVAFESAAEVLMPGEWASVSDKAKLEVFLKDQVTQGRIPEELAPKDWSRFCDNVYRALQAFSGSKPSGQSDVRLSGLDQAISILSEGFDRFYPDRFPRSVSLFQTVLGILSESGCYAGRRNDYYVLITDEMKMLFPGFIEGPGRPFEI